MIKQFYTKEYVRRSQDPDVFKEVHPHFIDFHRMTVHKDYQYPVHKHHEYELIYVGEGPYRCLLNETEICIANGGILIIKPGDNHQDFLRKGQIHYVLHFALNAVLFSPDIHPAWQKMDSGFHGIPAILGQIEDNEPNETNPKHFCGALQDALLETLFWYCIREIKTEALSTEFCEYSERQHFVSSLYALFSHYCHHPVSIDDIARQLHMSKRSLSLKSRRYLHCSPARLFREYRIQLSKRELAHRGKSISEISEELGFENPFDFSRVFTRVTGESPSSYRQRVNTNHS